MTDFEKLVSVLSDGRVDFIIVGGLAATAHGSARTRGDSSGQRTACKARCL
jgi:hypothetical protein